MALLEENHCDGDNLAITMINKDPSQISSYLNVLSMKLDKFEDDNSNKDDYQETKARLGIESMEGDKKVMFYLVERQEFEGQSLLEYIDSENVRLSRQREELIDLSVKIANLNNKGKTKKAMEEVINHYKSGLPSGVGLRDMITMIKEHFPCSHSKKILMILASLFTCLVGIGFYVLDLLTDIKFSLEMLNRTAGQDSSNQSAPFRNFLHEKALTFSSCESNTLDCWEEINTSFEKRQNNSIIVTNMDVDFHLAGWISVWHCIQPFVFSIVLIVGMTFNRSWGRSEQPWYLRVPIPVVSYLRCFWLQIRNLWSKILLFSNFSDFL